VPTTGAILDGPISRLGVMQSLFDFLLLVTAPRRHVDILQRLLLIVNRELI
jgi:hypothetical protein